MDFSISVKPGKGEGEGRGSYAVSPDLFGAAGIGSI